MRVHLTGGSGFLGGFVLPRLVAAGHEVYALARNDRAAARVSSIGATPVFGHFDEPASLDEAFRVGEPQALVNIASLGFGHAPAVVSAAEDAGLHRAVLVSTTAIFTTLEPKSKAVRIAAEETIRASSLDWTIVRPTMIYGTPDDRNMWRLLRLVRRCPVVPVPDGGRCLQQPVHVDDVAAAVVDALDCPATVSSSYDLAGPDPLTLGQIVTHAAAAVGTCPRQVSIPAHSAISVLLRIESTGRSGPIRAEQVQRLLEDKTFDITAARNDLHYHPRSFAAGIWAEARLGEL